MPIVTTSAPSTPTMAAISVLVMMDGDCEAPLDPARPGGDGAEDVFGECRTAPAGKP